MEVSIIGKALTPISHEYLASIPCDSRESETGTKQMYLPLSRRYSDIESLKFDNEAIRNQSKKHIDLRFERSRLTLTPAFQNMTLAETYNFARAQLKQAPMQNCKSRRNLWTPTLSLPKVDPVGRAQNSQADHKDLEASMSHAPVTSRGNKTPEKSLPVSAEHGKLPKSSKRRRAKSVYGHKKLRRKSGRKKKSAIATVKSDNILHSSNKLMNGIVSPRYTSIPLPTKLQPSPALSQNTTEQMLKNDMVHAVKRATTQSNRERTVTLPITRLSRRYTETGVNDPLLSSLDTALSTKEKCARELSMRIQLIHRYGNEDIIGKHVEMKRKREAANRHEKKCLEQQANERMKDLQRSKIYALNRLMTRLEQKQFEEYKQSL